MTDYDEEIVAVILLFVISIDSFLLGFYIREDSCRIAIPPQEHCLPHRPGVVTSARWSAETGKVTCQVFEEVNEPKSGDVGARRYYRQIQ